MKRKFRDSVCEAKRCRMEPEIGGYCELHALRCPVCNKVAWRIPMSVPRGLKTRDYPLGRPRARIRCEKGHESTVDLPRHMAPPAGAVRVRNRAF